MICYAYRGACADVLSSLWGYSRKERERTLHYLKNDPEGLLGSLWGLATGAIE